MSEPRLTYRGSEGTTRVTVRWIAKPRTTASPTHDRLQQVVSGRSIERVCRLRADLGQSGRFRMFNPLVADSIPTRPTNPSRGQRVKPLAPFLCGAGFSARNLALPNRHERRRRSRAVSPLSGACSRNRCESAAMRHSRFFTWFAPSLHPLEPGARILARRNLSLRRGRRVHLPASPLRRNK
jgi:hypothetical protein